MNLDSFKSELRTDIKRLQAALAALEGTDSGSTSIEPAATPPALTDHRRGRGRRTLSPETRKKISKAMKANWKHGGRGGRGRQVSDAVRAKISAAQKARWAKQKEAANQATAQAA